jgi:DinB superfamily
VIETIFPAIADSELTTEEITTASRHLAVTRGFLVESLSGLSAAQWNFKPDNDAWSIAEVMEHLVIFEGRVHAIIGNMSNAPESVSGGKQIEMDRFVLNEVAKRTIKINAPIPVRPTHRWSGPEALQFFIASREQSIQLLAAPLLRGRVMPHPFFGPWDGYQWLLAVASHTARHTEQIREVKADRSFPQASTPPLY